MLPDDVHCTCNMRLPPLRELGFPCMAGNQSFSRAQEPKSPSRPQGQDMQQQGPQQHERPSARWWPAPRVPPLITQRFSRSSLTNHTICFSSHKSLCQWRKLYTHLNLHHYRSHALAVLTQGPLAAIAALAVPTPSTLTHACSGRGAHTGPWPVHWRPTRRWRSCPGSWAHQSSLAPSWWVAPPSGPHPKGGGAPWWVSHLQCNSGGRCGPKTRNV